jgi:hypothetical protein
VPCINLTGTADVGGRLGEFELNLTDRMTYLTEAKERVAAILFHDTSASAPGPR